MEAIIFGAVAVIVIEFIILMHYRSEAIFQKKVSHSERKNNDRLYKEKRDLNLLIENELGYRADPANSFKLTKIKKK